MEMVKQLTPRTRASTEALCKPSSPPRLSISPPFVLSLSLESSIRVLCRSCVWITPRHTRPNPPSPLLLHPSLFSPIGLLIREKRYPSTERISSVVSLNSERERIERVYYPLPPPVHCPSPPSYVLPCN